MVRLTGSAISITRYEQVGVILLSILSNTLDVHEVLLRSNVGLVEVEEHRNRSGHELTNSLRSLSGLLVSQSLTQTAIQASVLSISIVELCVEGVDLALREGLDSVHIGSLVPTHATEVEGQTELSGEPTVVVLRRGVTTLTTIVPYAAFEVVTAHSHTEVEVEEDALRELPSVQQTSASCELVSIVRAVASNTNTEVRNEVPNASVTIATQHVAQVEEHLFLCIPELDVVEVLVLSEPAATIHSSKLRAKTETRGEPLTNCYREAGSAAEILEGTLCEIHVMLFVRIESIPRSIHLDEPVLPERVCCYAILQRRIFLCH